MSRNDFQEFSSIVSEFKYKSLAISFATNTIFLTRKLASRRRTDNYYIMIDPPWQLWHQRTLVTESLSYPNPHGIIGSRLEKKWLNNAGRGFNKQTLLSLTLHQNRIALFRFSDGWQIHASGLSSERDNGSWYDDWYAKSRSASP